MILVKSEKLKSMDPRSACSGTRQMILILENLTFWSDLTSEFRFLNPWSNHHILVRGSLTSIFRGEDSQF